MMYVDKDGRFWFLIPMAIGAIINVADHWGEITKGDGNGVWKFFAYAGVGAGNGALMYFGGPIGAFGGSMLADATNSLIHDGNLNQYDVGDSFNKACFATVGSLLGSSVGNGITDKMMEWGASELASNLTGQIIGSNISRISSTFMYQVDRNNGDINQAWKNTWNDYTENGGWWRASLSGAGSGTLKTYDPRTIYLEKEVRKEVDRNSYTNESEVLYTDWAFRLQVAQYQAMHGFGSLIGTTSGYLLNPIPSNLYLYPTIPNTPNYFYPSPPPGTNRSKKRDEEVQY